MLMCGRSSRATRMTWVCSLRASRFREPAHAQRAAGELRLEVKDPSGAGVAASGKLENLSTGTVQRFETDTQGAHSFTGLPYGRYRLEVTAWFRDTVRLG